MVSMNSNEIKEELNQKGIKNTRAKSILLHILKNSNAPKDVSSLYEECSKVTSVNLATVYRTLRQFNEKKIVQEFLGSDGVAQYEYIHQGAKSHPHFQCETCHRVLCLGELSFDDALYFSNMAKQHKINAINITLTGVCEQCQ
ncbi:MAG TPA: transcriptional repressor [Campylobacterales bacterium]|nr:transcriptional repressor [Campylobacterales bacterium]